MKKFGASDHINNHDAHTNCFNWCNIKYAIDRDTPSLLCSLKYILVNKFDYTQI